ncbi:hypothetical protein LITTLEE_187 [Mycobacterium phage LittleE]|uniref:Uncharacterized protein n=1 Tax=Mycobacterium phage LittleE TaxID=2922212 RepID=G1D472_9CAUD|nr:hypothetical protein FGG27_gp187 [Mycobacterium phage LittleE]AEK09612.1 hypothetical protein LITTLEE_187 [Mycobacterium phage LittleE]
MRASARSDRAGAVERRPGGSIPHARTQCRGMRREAHSQHPITEYGRVVFTTSPRYLCRSCAGPGCSSIE